MINSDGTNLAQLTGTLCELAVISWLPDSSRVLYQHRSDIYAVNRDGSSQTLFASVPKDDTVDIFDLFLPSVALPTAISTATLTP